MFKKFLSVLTTVSISMLTISGLYSSAITVEAKAPVEILSLRSEYSKHFDNGDGTITAYINSAPLHFLHDSEWEKIDNSLILDENGNYTNSSNIFNVTIPSKISKRGGKENEVQLEYNDITSLFLWTIHLKTRRRSLILRI